MFEGNSREFLKYSFYCTGWNDNTVPSAQGFVMVTPCRELMISHVAQLPITKTECKKNHFLGKHLHRRDRRQGCIFQTSIIKYVQHLYSL